MPRKHFRILFAFLAASSFIAILLPANVHENAKATVIDTTAPAQTSMLHVRSGLGNILAPITRLLQPDQSNELAIAQEELRRLRELLIIEKSRGIDRDRIIVGLGAFDQFAREHYGEKLDVIPARIIGRDATRRPGMITIDKGRADGVRPQAGVVWGNAAVGVVAVAGERASLVKLLTSPACRVPAYIQRTGESTLIEGTSADLLQMRHVFRERAEEADICLTSGELGMFPRDIIIGEIVQAELPPGAMFQEIRIRPHLNLGALQTVVVLVREKGEF